MTLGPCSFLVLLCSWQLQASAPWAFFTHYINLLKDRAILSVVFLFCLPTAIHWFFWIQATKSWTIGRASVSMQWYKLFPLSKWSMVTGFISSLGMRIFCRTANCMSCASYFTNIHHSIHIVNNLQWRHCFLMTWFQVSTLSDREQF